MNEEWQEKDVKLTRDGKKRMLNERGMAESERQLSGSWRSMWPLCSDLLHASKTEP